MESQHKHFSTTNIRKLKNSTKESLHHIYTQDQHIHTENQYRNFSQYLLKLLLYRITTAHTTLISDCCRRLLSN
jgi:hypothetical protein